MQINCGKWEYRKVEHAQNFDWPLIIYGRKLKSCLNYLSEFAHAHIKFLVQLIF